MEVSWIKLDTNIFNNRKIRQISAMENGNILVLLWIKLLVLAGNVNDGGMVYFTLDIAYTDETLAQELDTTADMINTALDVFAKYRMITRTADGLIMIENWVKYQNVAGMDRIKEQTRVRVQRYRDKQKKQSNATCNATVTQCNAIDKKRKEKIRKENNNADDEWNEHTIQTCKELGIDVSKFQKQSDSAIDFDTIFRKAGI